jgi:hypothetical protein
MYEDRPLRPRANRDDPGFTYWTGRSFVVLTLQVVQLKPNPLGKDRGRAGATAAQLGGEWIDLRNTGFAAIDLAGVEIHHVAYGAGGTESRWEKVASLLGRLDGGRVLRVHAGQRRDLSVLLPEDRTGADLHSFTGSDAYVWNNRQGDTALVWLPASSQEVDRAAYGPNPPEGAVFTRYGSMLMVQAGHAAPLL